MRSGIEKLDISHLTEEEIDTKGRDSVADALAYLTSSTVKNFYARVISGVDRVAVRGIGTMGITARRGKYLMMYDPAFAASVCQEELFATVEHEVLHIMLHHIPRYLALAGRASGEDAYLHKIVSNLAMDLADNQLLIASWPRMRNPDKPLGYWVLPEGFNPHLPKDMSFEVYQMLLFDTLKKRMTASPKQMYQMASAMLKNTMEKAQKALSQLNQQQNENSSAKGSNDDASNGQQQPGQQSAQGSGSDNTDTQPKAQENNPYNELTPEQLKQEAEKLDPIDQEILKMLLSSMNSHALIEAAAQHMEDGEAHQLEQHGREIIKNAAKSYKKSRGTLPGNIEELIQKMLMPPTVPWTQFLHNIVQKTRQTKKSRGMARPSKTLSALRKYAQMLLAKNEEETPLMRSLKQVRRVPPFPGSKQSNKYTIVYAVDTSGSMGTDELEKGLSELQHLQKSDSDINICVIYADTAVCKEYWITPTSELDQNLTGRGGTDFEYVFQHVQKMSGNTDKSPDILIYCTDGYAPPPTTKLPIPTVWLITPRGAPVMRDAGHITIQMRDYQLGESY